MLLFFSCRARSGRSLRVATVLMGGLVLAACSGVGNRLSSVGSLVTPYKIDIVQGNVVTREQAQALQPGMSRAQVRDILGTPLLTSVFHGDRWDYVFSFRRQGQPTQQRKLTVFFKADVLDRFEADELPSESEFVASLDVRQKTDKQPVLEATEEQLKAFEAKNAQPATATPAPPLTPPTSYPPLETPESGR